MLDIAPIIAKVRVNHGAIEQQLSNPEIFADRDNYEKLSREHQRLTRLITNFDEAAKLRQELVDSSEMLTDENDEEFREVVHAEVSALEEQIKEVDAVVMSLIMPPSENDSRNTIVEIRPAAGGDEAGLFAGDLFRMYVKFAEKQKWKSEVLNLTESSVGGIKEVGFALEGSNVYQKMKYEGGVHRVQRVPTTETSGRIHTSTITVAILPEAKEVDLKINPEDLRMDVFRSSGPGGQSVNTTDSAVRITHVPTGLSVASQQEKSQHRNREIAMRILRSRLLEAMEAEEAAKHADERRSQIGTGDRSERIRTYNYPQNRVTDHRFALSWYNLPDIMEGNIEQLFNEIIAVDNCRALEKEIDGAM